MPVITGSPTYSRARNKARLLRERLAEREKHRLVENDFLLAIVEV